MDNYLEYEQELESMTVRELHASCKEWFIKGYSGKRKVELVAVLKRRYLASLLKNSVEEWNRLRREHPNLDPDLRCEDLRYADLGGADLTAMRTSL